MGKILIVYDCSECKHFEDIYDRGEFMNYQCELTGRLVVDLYKFNGDCPLKDEKQSSEEG